MRNRFASVVSDMIDTDPRVAVVLADISADRFRSVRKRHPARVINVGIREQLLVDVGAGMALEGMRPVVHTFAPFLVERAFEQVKLGLSHQGVGAILVSAGASYDEAAYGRTHQAPEDVALVGTLPGWRIYVPGHPDEVEAFLREAAGNDDAVYIRLSESSNAAPHATGGRLMIERRGSAGAPVVVAVGPMLDRVIEATAAFDVTVLYAATVRPFDVDGLRDMATGSDVILVEPYLEGTSAGDVSAALADRPHRLLSIGVPRVEHRKYGSAREHDIAHEIDAPGLRRRIGACIAANVAGQQVVG